MTSPLQVLIVEDMEDDVLMILRELRRGGFAPEHCTVISANGMQLALASRSWDIVISEYSLPSFSGLAALEMVKQHAPDLPVIIVSGAIGEETAVALMKAGAQDYVMKSALGRLVPAVERELRDAQQRRAHRQTELALQKNEILLRKVLDTLPVGVIVADEGGGLVMSNPAGIKIWGGAHYVSPDDYAVYKGWWTESGEKIEAQDWALVRAIKRRETSLKEMVDIECFDGTRKTILNSAIPLLGAADELLGAIVINEDITAQRQAQSALRVSQERFHAFMDNIPALAWMKDGNFRYIYSNRALQRFFGKTGDQLSRSDDFDLFAAETAAVLRRNDEKTLASEAILEVVETLHDADRQAHTLMVLKFPMRDAAGSRFVCGVGIDISERKKMEEALQSANRRLQALSGRVLEIQEGERRHVARELHDEIGQALTAVKINLQSLLRQKEVKPLLASVDDCIAIVDGALGQVRSMSLDLRPSQLDDLGLVAALRWYLDRQARMAGVTVGFTADPLPRRLDAAVETACFRIAQEAVTNALRHSRAQRVWVELRQHGDELGLEIRDNGTGFDVVAARGGAVSGRSLGLLGMEERAGLAGGRLEIVSAANKGTEIHVRFSLVKARARRPARTRQAAR
ncbi:MAG: PAS domain-containing protein [Pseudomonadota bacterium]